MSACKWRRLCKLCTPVANLLDPQVAFCNEVICCVLQLEILGLPALAIAPVLYDQRNQGLSWHRRWVTGGVAIFIAVMHSATPQRRKTAIEKGILGGKRKKSRVVSTAEPGERPCGRIYGPADRVGKHFPFARLVMSRRRFSERAQECFKGYRLVLTARCAKAWRCGQQLHFR